MHQETLKQFEDFIANLKEVKNVNEQLMNVVQNKHRAMRTGNLDSLQSCSAREKFLIDKISEIEKAMQTKFRTLAEHLNINPESRVLNLAEKLAEPHRSRLLILVGTIRSTTEKIYQINQINDEVTRHILNCFADVQRQITAVSNDIGLYDTNGNKQLANQNSILDAVG